MKEQVPYNAGEIRICKNSDDRKVFIAGHIWWPVEQRNAYHCLFVQSDGSLSEKPEYIWDTTNGGWPLAEAA